MHHVTPKTLPLLLALATATCVEPVGPRVCETIEGCEFAPELEIDLSQMTRTASGLYWQDLRAGAGSPVIDSTFVMYHSVGWLSDGTLLFDSHVPDASCNCVVAWADTVGIGQLIPGWEEGFLGMRLGTIRRMLIPPELAYGAAGGGVVPPNAVIVSEVEVLALDFP